jgi:hypothetical protein
MFKVSYPHCDVCQCARTPQIKCLCEEGPVPPARQKFVSISTRTLTGPMKKIIMFGKETEIPDYPPPSMPVASTDPNRCPCFPTYGDSDGSQCTNKISSVEDVKKYFNMKNKKGEYIREADKTMYLLGKQRKPDEIFHTCPSCPTMYRV